jgi:hypothetical protein
MHTPQTISAHLLSAILAAMKDLSDADQVNIDQGVLLLGMAETLGDLLGTISPEAQKVLVPQVLQLVIRHIPGGTLLVVKEAAPEEPPMH